MTYTTTTKGNGRSVTATCDSCGCHRTGPRPVVTAWQRSHSCRDELLEQARRAATAKTPTPKPEPEHQPTRLPRPTIQFRRPA